MTSAAPAAPANTDGWEVWFPDSYKISAEAVRSFAQATRDPHIAYGERRILGDDTYVPMTLLAARMFDAAAIIVSNAITNCNLSRIVHAAQQFTVVEPLKIDQRISFGASLISHTFKADTDILVIDTAAYADGTLRLRGPITIAHSATGGPEVDLDAIADEIMLTGTGPSQSNAYSGV